MATKEKLATPIWDLSDSSDQVYEPSEDSFLLLDALEEDLPLIRRLKPLHILEVGSGSGIIITSLAQAFEHSFCLAIDINPHACLSTIKTAQLNDVKVDVVRGDLLCGLKSNRMIDVFVFNPPYVPSIKEEEKGLIDKAWAGDIDGRSTTDRLFPCLTDLMSDNCVGYIVAIEENNPTEMCHILETVGFKAEVVKRRKIIGEKLSIIRFLRSH